MADSLADSLLTDTVDTEEELVAEMGNYYAAAGYKRGINGVKNLLQILTNKNIITRSQNGYDFHPDYLNHVFHNDEDEV